MTERPILFSPPMIRALLLGRKTVTRRLSKQWSKVKAGDALWVKEGWKPDIAHGCAMNTCDCGDVSVTYLADKSIKFFEDAPIPDNWTMPKAAARGRVVTSLFMPRWASRITLDVLEDAREERLQDMTEEEAKREGVNLYVPGHGPVTSFEISCDPGYLMYGNYRLGFEHVWRSLHTKPGERWEDNPTVRRVGAFTVRPAADEGGKR